MATCGPVSTEIPIGGQGQSSRCSRIYWISPNCTSGITLDGAAPSGAKYWFSEQVTRIEVRSMVANRKYGHDKSFCWQDVTKGLASCNGTIQSKMQCCDPPISFHAGDTIWLSIWPLGESNQSGNTPEISGYAEIEEDPIVMNLENGDPVEHNYTYSSKGRWNLPSRFSNGTFDCCGCCETPSGNFETLAPHLEGSVYAPGMLERGLLQTPKTVYQWTDKGEWAVALDETSGQFMPGPMPTEAGQFVGQMKFVNCVSAA